jgi:hypothetical protein
MHNWKQAVGKKLRALKACSPQFAESVTEELASHLEDSYEEHLRAGLPKEAALEQTLSEIEHCRGNWLAIRLLKEGRMTEFIRKVGLPGLLTFASAMAIAWALNFMHIQPKTIFLSNGLFLSLPIAWMCLLPVCGALGAILSRRSGGSRLDCMITAAFPALIFGAVLFLISVVGFAISLFVPDYGWHWRIVVWGLGLWGLGYFVLPAFALLLGSAAAHQITHKHSSAA